MNRNLNVAAAGSVFKGRRARHLPPTPFIEAPIRGVLP